jgi:hypothetical protein
VLLFPVSRAAESRHESQTHWEIARRLARLKALPFGGEYPASGLRQGAFYFVPSDTIVGLETAEALGIHSEDDLFGGVVPQGFVATKAITHPLVAPQATAPEGWSDEFPRQVKDAVLAGFTAFRQKDALRAGTKLLERGALRIKPVLARGGSSQTLVHDADGLKDALDAIAGTIASGLVIEENLTQVTTCSVGQVHVAELLASYFGIQRLTRDNDGSVVYGGSDLVVARGDFDALLKLGMGEASRIAVEQACIYDAAAKRCFPGLLASRRNYDVAQGRKRTGAWCSGVLEQSWRIGGASTAEVLALEAFRADPRLRVVRAWAVEEYGNRVRPPEHATIFCRGSDEQVGPITKYALIESP